MNWIYFMISSTALIGMVFLFKNCFGRNFLRGQFMPCGSFRCFVKNKGCSLFGKFDIIVVHRIKTGDHKREFT